MMNYTEYYGFDKYEVRYNTMVGWDIDILGFAFENQWLYSNDILDKEKSIM